MNVVLRLMEAAVEFVWWWGWGLHSNFHVQPNYSVEVVLRCVVVGVVTIKRNFFCLTRFLKFYWFLSQYVLCFMFYLVSHTK